MDNQWHDIGDPGVFSRKSEKKPPKQHEEIVEPAAQPAASEDGPEVRLGKPEFVGQVSKLEINKPCSVRVSVEFLKETVRKRVLFDIDAEYKGNKESVVRKAEGFAGEDGYATAEIKSLYAPDAWSGDNERKDTDTFYYIITASHANAEAPAQSDRVAMPQNAESEKYSATLVNQANEPKPNVNCRIVTAGHNGKELATGPDGRVEAELVAGDTVTLVLPDYESTAPEQDNNSSGAAGDGSAIHYQKGGVTLEANKPVTIIVPQRSFCLRLKGMYFETNKCFLLPSALANIKKLKQYSDEKSAKAVLIVGHTDRVGSPENNLVLSQERAESVLSFLHDDADNWLAWYDAAKPAGKRWGTREDQHMLSHLSGGGGPFYTGKVDGSQTTKFKEAAASFQSWANGNAGESLKVDGVIGPKTRRAMIVQYQAEDQTTLDSNVTAATLGLGEYFPQIQTADNIEEKKNRRVEVFMFEQTITPEAPGKGSHNCPQYEQWISGVCDTLDLAGDDADESGALTLVVNLTLKDVSSVALSCVSGQGKELKRAGINFAERKGETGYAFNLTDLLGTALPQVASLEVLSNDALVMPSIPVDFSQILTAGTGVTADMLSTVIAIAGDAVKTPGPLAVPPDDGGSGDFDIDPADDPDQIIV
jgi:outer membrane protein OmpA-like peptidoglycan-associated protein